MIAGRLPRGSGYVLADGLFYMHNQATAGILYRLHGVEADELGDVKNFTVCRKTGCIGCGFDSNELYPVVLAPPGFIIAESSCDEYFVVNTMLGVENGEIVKRGASETQSMWFVATIDESICVPGEPCPVAVIFSESPEEAVVARRVTGLSSDYDTQGRSTSYSPCDLPINWLDGYKLRCVINDVDQQHACDDNRVKFALFCFNYARGQVDVKGQFRNLQDLVMQYLELRAEDSTLVMLADHAQAVEMDKDVLDSIGVMQVAPA